MNKKIVSVSGLLAVTALLAFAACHKSSSSSASGSAAGAASGLTALAFGGAESSTGGTGSLGVHPRTSGPCSSGSATPGTNSFIFASTTTSVCLQGATAYTDGGAVNLAFSSCTVGGYTYNGSVSFSIPATGGAPFVVCKYSTYMTASGSFGFNASGLSISGNGFNCPQAGGLNSTIQFNSQTGTASGSTTGSFCGTQINESW